MSIFRATSNLISLPILSNAVGESVDAGNGRATTGGSVARTGAVATNLDITHSQTSYESYKFSFFSHSYFTYSY